MSSRNSAFGHQALNLVPTAPTTVRSATIGSRHAGGGDSTWTAAPLNARRTSMMSFRADWPSFCQSARVPPAAESPLVADAVDPALELDHRFGADGVSDPFAERFWADFDEEPAAHPQCAVGVRPD